MCSEKTLVTHDCLFFVEGLGGGGGEENVGTVVKISGCCLYLRKHLSIAGRPLLFYAAATLKHDNKDGSSVPQTCSTYRPCLASCPLGLLTWWAFSPYIQEVSHNTGCSVFILFTPFVGFIVNKLERAKTRRACCFSLLGAEIKV